MRAVRIHIIRTIVLVSLFLPLLLGAQSPAPATLLGRWTDEALPGSNTYNNRYNEVWGLVVNDREYAVIGSTLGTHFIDVTRPQDAKEVAFVAGASSGPHIIHRDYHNYGYYLYAVSDEGSGSLQIMDVSRLPDTVRVVYDDDTFLGRSHNIFIDTSRAVLYACYARGGGSTTTPLKLLDISDPIAPVELATYRQFGSGTVSHVHDAYVEDGIAFLHLGFDGMAIVDFTDPQQAKFLSTLTDYPFAGYNHSGWRSPDGSHYYLADESHGFPMKILDISDLSEIEVTGTFDAGSPNELSIPHNQIAACNYLYVSYYYDGLQVYDISDPGQPRRISYFGTSSRGHRKSYEGAWGVYPFLPSGNVLISDMQEGLFIVSGPEAGCDLLSAVRSNETEPPLRIYPQPARDRLTVTWPAGKGRENVNIDLLDIQGRQLQRWEKENPAEATDITLNLDSAVPAGMYLLRFRISGRTFTKKIIIRP